MSEFVPVTRHAMVEAASRHRRVVQVATQWRSGTCFGETAADRLVARDYRKPWTLPYLRERAS